MDTQTQIERLIELAIVQRTELKQLVEQLPSLRDHLNAEVERTFEEAEPTLRAELEDFITKETANRSTQIDSALSAKIETLAKNLQDSAQAKFSAVLAARDQNAELLKQAEQKIAEAAAALPANVKEIVTAELARFPRAGEIDQLRKEFAEPRGLNPRGKWSPDETYQKLDLVSYNGDSFVSSTDGNREKPSRNGGAWTLSAARGGYGGGGGITSLNDVLNAPTTGQIIGSQNGQYVPKTLAAGANITITENANTITIIGDEGQITLQDGTAAAPSLFFQNDPDTGLYRPAANTVGIAVSGTQIAYFDPNGLTIPNAGIEAGGSLHAANGNANNPSLSFTGDQDTGFFRHQPNEIGIALGGTQYGTLTSTTFSWTPALSVAGVARVTNSTASTSTSTGALVVTGGVGIGGAQYVGGNLTVSGTGGITASTSGNTPVTITSTDAATGAPYIRLGYNSNLSGQLMNDAATGAVYLDSRYNDPSSAVVIRTKASGTPVTCATFNASGNTTLSGNLTVSGTGTATRLIASSTDSTGTVLQVDTSATAYGRIGGSNSMGWVANTQHIFSAGGSEYMRLNASGNLLLKSDGVDSANGKLQLATHTTSAGGIGFGTDVSLYRAAAQSINLDGSSSPQFSLSVSGTQKARFEAYSDDLYISTLTAGKSMILRSGNAVTALTIDSSQNATFAGTIVPKASTGSAVFALDTNAQTFTVANNATATPFGNANNFSGLFIITDTNNTGKAAVVLAAGGTLTIVSQTGTSYSTTSGNANTTNVYLNAYVVTVENKSGTSTAYNVTALRTRNAQ